MVHTRLKRLSIVLAISLAVIVGVGFWVSASLPTWIKTSAQKQVQEILGRELDWERIEWSLSDRRIVIYDLTIGTLLSAKKLEAVFDTRSIVERAPIIESFSIDQPTVNMVRLAEGEYDFSDILQRLAKRPKQEPLRFAISNIQVANGQIQIVDRLFNKNILFVIFRFRSRLLTNWWSQPLPRLHRL